MESPFGMLYAPYLNRTGIYTARIVVLYVHRYSRWYVWGILVAPVLAAQTAYRGPWATGSPSILPDDGATMIHSIGQLTLLCGATSRCSLVLEPDIIIPSTLINKKDQHMR